MLAYLVTPLALLVPFVQGLDVSGHEVPHGRGEVTKPALVPGPRRVQLLGPKLPAVLLLAFLGVDAPPVHLEHLLPLCPVVAVFASK